jgi:type 1 fimbriae regulatory protein FimB/type 1 fimbriae regulatory protein FimE
VLRTREHLTDNEVLKLIEAAKGNRRGHRDATMILITFGRSAKMPLRKLASIG